MTAYGLNDNVRNAPTSNLDTFDPARERVYNAFNLEFRARPGGGAQIFGGLSFEREVNVNCTAPDNPNSLRFCDETHLEDGMEVPFRRNFKASGTYPMPWGVTFSAALQSNIPALSTRTMVIRRGVSRYPSTCPAPCPAGAIIGPNAIQGQTTLTMNLVSPQTVQVERITQFDLKLSKTFRVGRVSVLPTLEIFNLNNTDAIVTYQSTDILSQQYRRPAPSCSRAWSASGRRFGGRYDVVRT